MPNKTHRGFTLIELMIAVAVVGILAATAIPVYSTYTIRARVAEGLSLARDAKYNVAHVLANGNSGASSDGYSSGYLAPASTKNVSSVSIDPATGIVTITMSEIAGNGTLTIGPTVAGNALPEGTSTFSPPQGMLLWRCAASGAGGLSGGQIAGSLPARYAPGVCR
jgi:type IV pilus assembly protein PilA